MAIFRFLFLKKFVDFFAVFPKSNYDPRRREEIDHFADIIEIYTCITIKELNKDKKETRD